MAMHLPNPLPRTGTEMPCCSFGTPLAQHGACAGTYTGLTEMNMYTEQYAPWFLCRCFHSTPSQSSLRQTITIIARTTIISFLPKKHKRWCKHNQLIFCSCSWQFTYCSPRSCPPLASSRREVLPCLYIVL